MTLNGAQFHLLINHFPVVGFPIVLLAYAWGYARNEVSLVRFAIYLYFLIWISTVISYFTGDGAEHVLKVLPEFNQDRIHKHEDIALISLVLSSLLILPAFAQTDFLIERIQWLHGKHTQARLKVLILVGLLVLIGFLAVTAHLGGVIRHPEIS